MTPGERAAYYRRFIDAHREAAGTVRASGEAEWADELDGMADDRAWSLSRLEEVHGPQDGVEVLDGRFHYADGYSDELGGGW